MAVQVSLAGSIRAENRRLLETWWRELGEAEQQGRPVGYVFVMGSMAEVLTAFDILVAVPEVWALQAAMRDRSKDFIGEAEDYGYSPDICGYVKTDVGVQLRGGVHPNGKVPKPSLVVAPNTCNTYIKWAEIWERLYGCPTFVLDLPSWRGTGFQPDIRDETFRADCRYVEGQIRELVALCEQITGKRFDIDRLREAMDQVNRMADVYQKVLALNRHRPAPFSAVGDGVIFQGISNLYRGRPEGTRFFEVALDEIRERVQKGVGTIPEEKFRLLLVGTACYSHFKRFLELFNEWGGAFVHSTYMVFAGGGFEQGVLYDLSRPIESLAEQTVRSAWMSFSTSIFWPQEWLARVVEEWSVDGICFHGVKSCRTTSTGLPDVREWLRNRRDVPGLFIQSDLVDPRLWSDAQLKNRIDAFFEALASRKAAERR